MEFFAGYIILGCLSGLLAGLLGVGGGAIIVPVLIWLFYLQGIFGDHITHVAIGTSLASIIFTSIASFMAHNKHQGVLWTAFWKLVPGILVGTVIGALIADNLTSLALQRIVGGGLFMIALHLVFGKSPKPHRQLPGWAGMSTAGTFIGSISSLIGIGGGSLTVPFLTWCNVPTVRAIGTSAAAGLPIAVGGTISFIVAGWDDIGLGNYALGFIHLPALAGITCTSIFCAPVGAGLAHKLPAQTLKRIFAAVLAIVSLKMLLL